MKWTALDRAIALWVCLIGTCAVIFVCAGLAGLIAENSANLASWVQAIGSIVTIASGVWGVRYQLAAQRKEARQRELAVERNRISSALQSLLGRTAQIALVLKKADERINKDAPNWSSLAKTTRHLSSMVDAIHPAELPTPSTSAMLSCLRAPISSLAQALDEAASATEVPDGQISSASITMLRNSTKDIHAAALRSHRWLFREAEKIMTPEEFDAMVVALRELNSQTSSIELKG